MIKTSGYFLTTEEKCFQFFPDNTARRDCRERRTSNSFGPGVIAASSWAALILKPLSGWKALFD